MTETNILQAILDSQVSIKKDLINLDEKIGGVEIRHTDRINKIGLQLAVLDDDAPSKDEFDELD